MEAVVSAEPMARVRQKTVGGGRKRASTHKQPVVKQPKTNPTKPLIAADRTPPRDVVLAYMRQQNRPYNAQLIFDNLKRAIRKPDLERILELLVSDGCLIAKDIGKMRVFMYAQSQFKAAISCDGDMTSTIQALTEEVKDLEHSVRQRNATKQRLKEAQVRAEMLEGVMSRVDEAAAKLEAIKKDQQQGSQSVDEAEVSSAERAHAKLHAAWATQKRRCVALVQNIAEKTQADAKQLQKDLGLERDEDFIPETAYSAYG